MQDATLGKNTQLLVWPGMRIVYFHHISSTLILVLRSCDIKGAYMANQHQYFIGLVVYLDFVCSDFLRYIL